jgi:hypothetical protein
MRVILRSFLTFYSSFFMLAFLINLFCIAIIIKTEFNLFSLMFWFRAVIISLIYYFINDYKRKEFYYYQNLGVSKNFLWISTISLDSILFLLANLFIYLFYDTHS